MSKGGSIKKSHELSDVEPFSFESFDEPREQGLTEREEGDNTVVNNNPVPADTSKSIMGKAEMEILKPPDLEDLIIKKLNEVEREAQEIKSRAFEEGRAEGYRVGYEQGMEDARELARQCGEILKSLNDLPSTIMNDYKEWLVEAAFTIAKHILQEELSTKPQVLLGFIGRLIKEMEENVPVTIFLNPEDLSILRLGVDFEEWARTQGRSLKLAEDVTLERGSCRLESDISLLDASLDKILDEMKREIFMESGGHKSNGP